MPNRDDIVAAARNLYGVKWLHQGRNPKFGIDCVGLIALVGYELGLITGEETTNYNRRSHGMAFVEAFKEHMDQKSVRKAEPGDVLIFRDKAFPCHCGIMTTHHGVPAFVHAHAPQRKVVETIIDDEWQRKIIGCFQFRDV
jgi:cell wall-associated NlpC family hydrolase